MTTTPQRMLPLYEAKMIHHFDHRWATYERDGTVRDVTLSEKQDLDFEPLPRYWVREEVVDEMLNKRWNRRWFLGWRNIARATDERTTITSAFPWVGVGHSMPVMLTDSVLPLVALTSFISDFVSRQKVAGTNFTFNYFEQMPALRPPLFHLPPPWAKARLDDWLLDRVTELAYTADAIADLARDLGDNGPPFIWDVGRRGLLRAELDAAFFHLYGVERDDVDYIMEAFPIVKRKDIAAHGEFRTKRVILEIYDAMQRAIDTGTEYETILDPPPGQGSRHTPRTESP